MERKTYSFDGHGINGPDEYRTRLMTLTDEGHKANLGPLVERLLNEFSESLQREIEKGMQRA